MSGKYMRLEFLHETFQNVRKIMRTRKLCMVQRYKKTVLIAVKLVSGDKYLV